MPREDKTLADYVAIAISPALIMALVGSLVFFLVEVLYVGQYQARLLWILFFFVFGAVLIARISMQSEIAERAGLYGLVLGVLVWFALVLYVEYPERSGLASVGWAINAVLIAVIWWSAHRLTWDCTLIDDAVDASGAGLLEQAGLERSGANSPVPDVAPDPAAKKPRRVKTGLAGWWQRWSDYRAEQRRRPHTPGVWVVFFSLAALPLFGLGQMLLAADTMRRPAERADSQRYVLLLMAVYVASGLGLLLTTSFLGLRRYLRQRSVQMPAAVTSSWLTIGVILIATLLVVAVVLPRPSAEYRGVLEWLGLVSPERKASSHALLRDGAGRDKGRGSRDQQGADGQGTQSGSGQHTAKGDGGGDRKGQGAGRGSERGERGQDGHGGAGDGKHETGERTAESSWRTNILESLEELGPLATILKWIVGILVALAILLLLIRSGLRWLAHFTYWARRLLLAWSAWWAWLMGWWQADGAATGETHGGSPRESRPFGAFRDPFSSGEAARMSPNDLVRYSFEALEAWAVERGMARQADETPLEFAARLGQEFPGLETATARLAGYYAGLAYARRSLSADCHTTLRSFWRLLYDVLERPLSAV